MTKKLNAGLDVLLISPPVFYEDSDNIWKEINSNFPPLGLASIAACVRQKGYSVKIIDCNIVSPSLHSFEKFFKEKIVEKYASIRFIGLTAMTPTIKKAYKIADICKIYFPQATVVFGGVHTTFLYEEVLQKKSVDLAVIGEGEITFQEIVSGKKLKNVDGIAYKKKINGKIKIVQTKDRQRISDLNSLPMPAYDLLPILKYRPAKGTYKRLPAMSMITSRGCPGRCTFCSKTLGMKMVFKSAETIYKEIEFLVKRYGIKQILFYDDTLTVYNENVHKLCDLIIKNRLNISWTCFARVDFVDYNLLKKMKRAGCHQIMYGVESIDKRVLKNINKHINIKQVINATKWTKKARIECRLAFMVGNPGDNLKSIKKNITFVNKLNPDLLIVNITTPFPGTEMYKWAKSKGLILTYDWDDYNLSTPVMRLENLTSSQIKDLYKLMYKRFYFRPKYIFGMFFKIRHLNDILTLLSGAKSLISFSNISLTHRKGCN